MRYSSVKMIAAVTAMLLSGAAEAATISNTYTVVGSGFVSSVPMVSPPFATITESFTVTFDNTVTVSQQTSGITLNGASTIIPASPLVFTYIAGADSLIVGGTAATVATADPASTDFAIIIQNASNTTNFSITALSYSVGKGAFFTATSTTKGTPPVSTVPEPTSLALLSVAGAALAFVRRRRTM